RQAVVGLVAGERVEGAARDHPAEVEDDGAHWHRLRSLWVRTSGSHRVRRSPTAAGVPSDPRRHRAAAAGTPGPHDRRHRRRERSADEPGGAASTTVPPPPTSVAVAPPGGGFRIEVPGSWVVGYPNAHGAPLADQMVPDRPDDADHVALVEAALVAPDTRMVALDPAGLGDLERLPDLLVVDGIASPSLTAFGTERLLDLAAPVDEGVVGARGTMEGTSGEIGWVEIDLAAFDVQGVRYVATGSDTVWILTFWSHTLDEQRAMADEMVAGFDPD